VTDAPYTAWEGLGEMISVLFHHLGGARLSDFGSNLYLLTGDPEVRLKFPDGQPTS